MPFLALLGPALIQLLTKPWIYVTIISWFVVSKFDFGVFAAETRATMLSLWPLLLMFFCFLLVLEVIRIKMRGTGGK